MPNTIPSLSPNHRPFPRPIKWLAHVFRPFESITEEELRSGKSPQFRHLSNTIEVWGLQALVLVLIAVLLPGFWHQQLRDGLALFLLTFLSAALFFTAPWEWFFHRYGLHGMLLFRPFLHAKILPETDGSSRFVRFVRHRVNSITIACVYYAAKMMLGHGAHHKLTDVTPINPSKVAELFTARNKYEIADNERTEHAVFPHFAVAGFWLFFLPITLCTQLIYDVFRGLYPTHLPYLPLVIAPMVAMTWQVWLYENSHAILHKPYKEWWRPRIQRAVVGRWYSEVYRFHFAHHMNEDTSFGVAGAVFFLYFWDRLLGTYKLARLDLIDSASTVAPDVLELSKAQLMVLQGATPEDFALPGPVPRWIQFMDRQAVSAQETWNKLFVLALKEARRRKSVNESRVAQKTSPGRLKTASGSRT